MLPIVADCAREYPKVVLDVTTDDSPLDLVAGRFDAGIHLGEFIERDMIAVRVSRDHRPAIVGSPRYFESHPKPKSPRDLPRHRCINIRMGSAGVYRWEFDKGDESLTVAVDGPLNLDDVETSIRAAIDGAVWPFRSRSTWRRTSRVAHWCVFSRTRARRSPASSFTTPVGGSSRPHSRSSSRLFACRCIERKKAISGMGFHATFSMTQVRKSSRMASQPTPTCVSPSAVARARSSP
jgi:DNA-binding transcriptional LysR family regulator